MAKGQRGLGGQIFIIDNEGIRGRVHIFSEVKKMLKILD